jgi:polyhydroxybutyrate depolymerase
VLAAARLVRSSAQSLRARADDRHSAQLGFPAKGRLATAQKRLLTHDGRQRLYLVQPVASPASHSASEADTTLNARLHPGHQGTLHPAVILLHGGTQTAAQVWTQTSLPTIAAREGFLFAAPNALGGHWNDGRNAVLGGGPPSTADDVGFLKSVIADLVARDHADPAAIFLIGVSNGGFMTMRFACEAGDLLAAGGNIISGLPEPQQRACPSTKPLPWISMNGTDDRVVPFRGLAAHDSPGGRPHPEILSADATFHFWADRAGCTAATQTTTLPHLDPADPTRAERRLRNHCHGGASSVQYVFRGSGHMPPNLRAGLLTTRLLGRSNFDLDAGEAIWQHFRQALPK